MPTKDCPGCNTVRDAADFYRNRSRPDGLHSQCRWCARERAARYRQTGQRAEAERRRRRRR